MQYQIDPQTALTLLAALERATEELETLAAYSIKTQHGDFTEVDPVILKAAQDALTLAHSAPATPEIDLEALATFLSDLSDKDMGGGLSFDQTEIVLRQAEKIPAFGHWVAQCEDLEPVFVWLEAYEDAQHGDYPSADCIASGYEIACPICETIIHTIEIVENVPCPTCGTVAQIDEANHAEP